MTQKSIHIQSTQAYLLEDSDFKVLGDLFKYCKLDEDCEYTRNLMIGKSPWQLHTFTHCGNEFIGQNCDFIYEILHRNDDPLFDVSWTSKLDFNDQASILYYEVLPKPIADIKPGLYKVKITALTEDGNGFSEYTRLLRAI